MRNCTDGVRRDKDKLLKNSENVFLNFKNRTKIKDITGSLRRKLQGNHLVTRPEDQHIHSTRQHKKIRWSGKNDRRSRIHGTGNTRNALNKKSQKRTFVILSPTSKVQTKKLLKVKLSPTIINALKLLLDKKNHFQQDARALNLAKVLDMRNDTAIGRNTTSRPTWNKMKGKSLNLPSSRNGLRFVSVLKQIKNIPEQTAVSRHDRIRIDPKRLGLLALNQNSSLQNITGSSYRKSNIKLHEHVTLVNPTELGLSILKLLFGRKAHLVVKPKYRTRLRETPTEYISKQLHLAPNGTPKYHEEHLDSAVVEKSKQIEDIVSGKEKPRNSDEKDNLLNKDEQTLSSSVAALSKAALSKFGLHEKQPTFTQSLAKEISSLIKSMTKMELGNSTDTQHKEQRIKPSNTTRNEPQLHKPVATQAVDEDNTRKSWVLLKMPKTPKDDSKQITMYDQATKPATKTTSNEETIKIIQPIKATPFIPPSPKITADQSAGAIIREPINVAADVVQEKTQPELKGKLEPTVRVEQPSTALPLGDQVHVNPSQEIVNGFKSVQFDDKEKQMAPTGNEIKTRPELGSSSSSSLSSSSSPSPSSAVLNFAQSIALLLKTLKATQKSKLGSKPSESGATKSAVTSSTDTVASDSAAAPVRVSPIQQDNESTNVRSASHTPSLVSDNKTSAKSSSTNAALTSLITLLAKANNVGASNTVSVGNTAPAGGTDNSENTVQTARHDKDDIGTSRSSFYSMLVSALKEARHQDHSENTGHSGGAQSTTSDVSAKAKTSLPVPTEVLTSFKPTPARWATDGATTSSLSPTARGTSNEAITSLNPAARWTSDEAITSLNPAARGTSDEVITSLSSTSPRLSSDDNVLFQSDTDLGETRNVHDSSEYKKLKEGWFNLRVLALCLVVSNSLKIFL